MEPQEGIYTLDWLHQTLDLLGRHGISVVMCTPTAAPPAWLTTAYPDVLLVRGDGTRVVHGARKHYCSSSDTYRRHGSRITDEVSREMARHRNVVAWQLDNELGPEIGWCLAKTAKRAFRPGSRPGTARSRN